MERIKQRTPSFWISPETNLLEAPIIQMITNLTNRRCSSGKIIHLKVGSSPKKLKPVLKLSARQNSEKFCKKAKMPSLKSSKSKKRLPKTQTSKKLRKNSEKNIAFNKLKILEGKQKLRAPKIFENQLFRDVYDEVGNHDRIIETINASESFPEIVDEKDFDSDSLLYLQRDIDLELKEYEATEYKLKLNQPGNGLLQDTEDYFKGNKVDLLAKLQDLLSERSGNFEDEVNEEL